MTKKGYVVGSDGQVLEWVIVFVIFCCAHWSMQYKSLWFAGLSADADAEALHD